MKSGTRHLVGAGVGIAVAAAVAALLLVGEYEASVTQGWAAARAAPGSGSDLALVSGPVSGPVSSVRGAALIAVAAAAVGVVCGWRRLSPAAPLAAGLPLFGMGLLTWLDTWRVTLLFGGSLSLPWSRLVTDQVFLVTGGVLLIAASMPSRWRPGRARGRRSRRGIALAAGLGLVAIPVVWYLVQLTNLTAGNYPDSYWLPFHQNADDSVDMLFVLVVAILGVLAASRTLRITAIIAGAPMLVMGVLGLLAPGLAKDVIDGIGLGAAWRYAVLVDVTSGLPLLYGGILMSSGLMPAGKPRSAAVARAAKKAPAASVS